MKGTTGGRAAVIRTDAI